MGVPPAQVFGILLHVVLDHRLFGRDPGMAEHIAFVSVVA